MLGGLFTKSLIKTILSTSAVARIRPASALIRPAARLDSHDVEFAYVRVSGSCG
jgi:hypothetical protein